MKAGRVVVLAGGLSHERDVSLRSGRRVAESLRAVGVEAELRDVDARLVPDLRADPPSCVVPVLHGETGEDGAIREVLELLGIPYVGAPPMASRVAFDKPVAKAVLAREGVRTPTSVTLPQETFRELGAGELMSAILSAMKLPLFVKPAKSGSSLGCTTVRTSEDLPGAMVNAYAYGDTALVEEFVEGTEIAVTVVDTDGSPRALPAVSVHPDGGVYDYSARYTAGSTEFQVPAQLDAPLTDAAAQVALTAHRALGLRDLSRTDLIIDGDGAVWFLEVNVAPGMTETSLVPLAVAADGQDLGVLLSRLVDRARERGGSPFS